MCKHSIPSFGCALRPWFPSFKRIYNQIIKRNKNGLSSNIKGLNFFCLGFLPSVRWLGKENPTGNRIFVRDVGCGIFFLSHLSVTLEWLMFLIFFGRRFPKGFMGNVEKMWRITTEQTLHDMLTRNYSFLSMRIVNKARKMKIIEIYGFKTWKKNAERKGNFKRYVVKPGDREGNTTTTWEKKNKT